MAIFSPTGKVRYANQARIDDTIKKIREEVQVLGGSISQGKTSVDEGVDMANQAGEAIKTISEQAQVVLEAIEQLASDLELDKDY